MESKYANEQKLEQEFERHARYFANPHVLWTCRCAFRYRGKWREGYEILRACRSHTAEEIAEFLRNQEGTHAARHHVCSVELVTCPLVLVLESGFSLFGCCILCLRWGVLGLEEPLTDCKAIANACNNLSERCYSIQRTAELWHELLKDMATKLQARTGDTP